MSISEVRSQLGNFKYNPEGTTDFTVVAAAILSDNAYRNETVEYHVVPTNDNARAIFCALPWICPTPTLVEQTVGSKFGIVGSVHRVLELKDPRKEIVPI